MADVALRVGPRPAALAAEVLRAEVTPRYDRGRPLRAGEVLWLVPHRVLAERRREELLEQLAASGAPAGAFAPPFASLGEWLRRAWGGLPAGTRSVRLASAVERRLALGQVLALLPPEAAFGRMAEHVGFVEHLSALCEQLGLAGVRDGAALLARLGAGAGPHARALAAVFDGYLDALATRRLADRPRALAELAAALERGEARGPALLVVEGFDEPPALLCRLFAALAQAAGRTLVLLAGEPPPAAGGAGAASGAAGTPAALAFWLQQPAARLEPRAEPAERALSPRARARRAFRLDPYRPPAPPAPAAGQAAAPCDPQLVIAAAPSPAAELAAACRALALRLEREAGLLARLDRVALVRPAAPPYDELVRELLPRYGIPFVCREQTPLIRVPPVQAVLALLEAARSGLERAAVAVAFGSPYVGFTASDGQVLDYRSLDRLVRTAGIAGAIGSAGWQARLERLHQRMASALRTPLPAPLVRSEEHAEAAERASRRAAREHDLLQRGIPVLLEALRALEQLAVPAEPAAFAERTRWLAERFEVERRALLGVDPTLVARDLAALARLREVVGELARALQAAGPSQPDGRVELGTFLAALRTALGGERVNTVSASGPREGGAPPARLVVLAPEEVSGLEFESLYAVGLGAHAFAPPPPPDPVLQDSERTALGLPVLEQRRSAARRQLAALLAATEGTLWLAYSGAGAGAPASGAEPMELAVAPLLAELRHHLQPGGAVEPGGEHAPALTLAEIDARLGQLLESALAPGGAGNATVLAAIRQLGARRWRAPRPDGGELCPPAALLRTVRAALSRAGVWHEQLGPFEGVLEGPAAQALAAAALAQPLSPSRLNIYVRCPFRAFALHHLQLQLPPDPREDDTARWRGEVIHAVLRRFYEKDVAAPPPASASERERQTWLQRAAERLRAILEEVAGAQPAEDAFRQAELQRLAAGLQPGEADGPRGPLRAFLEWEARFGAGWQPRWLEQPLALQLPLPEPTAGAAVLSVHGVADRIDLAQADRALFVIDYKTGSSVPSAREMLAGLDLQLPIYLAAAAATFGPDHVPLAAAYYRLADPNAAEPRRLLADGAALRPGGPLAVARTRGHARLKDLPHALARLQQAVLPHLARAIGAGLFHPGHLPPARKGCAYCEARQVCRVDHARMARVAARPGARVFVPLPLEEGALP
ncbi:MAG: hypothetical protein KatS3mg102_0819 [Planctomycetota bacterium]|nr:MAG: hypothetical protein KatS3mg102_0819 [Planctomycetota bacterium]